MTAKLRRWGSLPAGMGLVAITALAGCTRVRDHKGYVVDSALVGSVQPGIDNRDSVGKTLGLPSLASEFDGGATYYYLSRDTLQFAFGAPHPVKQVLLTVRFGPGGDVASVQRTGLETIRKVSPYGKETPTLGSRHNFFSELFGGIGSVGSAGRGAPTTDNPSG